MKKLTHAQAIHRQWKQEIRDLQKQRRAAAREAHASLKRLLRDADRIVRAHRERDQILSRRIQIIQSRLSS